MQEGKVIACASIQLKDHEQNYLTHGSHSTRIENLEILLVTFLQIVKV